MNCSQISFKTPLGKMYMAATSKGICYLGWIDPGYERNNSSDILRHGVNELQEYFSGKRIEFSVPLDPLSGTEFQKKVWRKLQQIPYGETRSYTDLAKAIKSPLTVRAVGSANAKNPICIFVPCHRVISLSGGLSQYLGGQEMKRWLLDHEKKFHA